MNPRVIAVKPKSDFTLELKFENGSKGIFDMRPYLTKGVFKELKDPALFMTVKPGYGSIVWKNGQDLCPDTLYLECKKIKHSAAVAST